MLKANIIMMEKLSVFPEKIRSKAGMPAPTAPTKHHSKSLSQ